MSKRKRLAARLETAHEQKALVRVARGRDLEPIEGYVLKVGAQWVLLALLAPRIWLDGWVALRLVDMTGVVRRPNTTDFVRKALKLRRQWPPTRPAGPVRLRDTRSLLNSLRSVVPVAVYQEHEDPDVCFIGAIRKVGVRSVRLREISPRAIWAAGDSRHRLDSITRVEFGGDYEQALLDVGGGC